MHQPWDDEEEWEEEGEEDFDDEGFEEDWVDDEVVVDPLVVQLIEAAAQGDVALVGAALDQGVDIEARDSGNNALDMACQNGHVDVVALLLDRGADVNGADDGGWTPILLASEQGRLEVVELLHTRGAHIHHVNVNGENALHHAALNDHPPVCEFLLSKGVDLMAETNSGRTALNHYGNHIYAPLSPETKGLRCAALEAAWAAGPHPSQVQRRRDERWESRGPLLWVLAEHAYRPLQLRAQAIAAAALGAPLPVVQYSPKEDVLRSEGLVRYIVAFL